jgi:hypothetical protein
MKIPYSKYLKTFFIGFAVILVIFYLVGYLINSDKFLLWINPTSWTTGNCFYSLLLFFPLLILVFLFVLTYHWCEIDFDGIKVHRAFGIVTLHKWSEYVYVGPTVVNIKGNPRSALVCTAKLPYKKFRNSESYVLPQKTIQFSFNDEIHEALRKYCPNFSTEYENP